MLIRMGPDNAAVVKGKLRQIRVEVTSKACANNHNGCTPHGGIS